MPAITIILILELIASTVLINLPVSPSKKGSNVLGQSVLLAQDETPLPDQTPPPDQTTTTDQAPTPTDTKTINTTTEPVPAPTEPAPTDTTPLPTQTPPQPESSPTATTPSAPEIGTTPQETPEQSASASADLPILNADEFASNPSQQIDIGSQVEVSKEEQQLDQITNPALKAAALTTFASDKISDIDRFTKTSDFNSTSFASQRLSDQIDQLKAISSEIPTSQEIRQKLSDLCQQTNTTLRTNQEIVPEELEQDLEITRGQCLGY